MNFLITRPEHDDTTHYLSNWAKKVIGCAEIHSFNVTDLNREMAVQKEFESRIAKNNPCLVMLNGHGDDNLVTGHQNKPLLVGGTNDKLMKSRIVYALSCRSAKELGIKAVSSGAKSYTGYNDDFVFSYTPSMISRPLNDEKAMLFFEPSNLFIDSLIKGNTVEEARAKTEQLFKKNITKALGISHGANIAKNLWWDLRHFVSHGDLNATI
ncbi:MAG: hypothetical protein V1734_02380 [Nanoarchaeota archaeon]